MAEMRHVDADLMGAPRFQLQGKQRVIRKLFHDAVMGHGTLTRGVDFPHDGGAGHPQKGCVDGALRFVVNAFGHGDVFLFDPRGKLYRGELVFGDDADARGMAIQPPQRTEGDAGVAVSEKVAKRVVKFSRCRVNEDIVGLIEEDDILILVENGNVQIAVGRQYRLFIGKIDGDGIVFSDGVDVALKSTVDENAAFLLEADQHRLGIPLFAEEIAEPRAVVFFCDDIGFDHEFILICFVPNVK